MKVSNDKSARVGIVAKYSSPTAPTAWPSSRRGFTSASSSSLSSPSSSSLSASSYPSFNTTLNAADGLFFLNHNYIFPVLILFSSSSFLVLPQSFTECSQFLQESP
eukprot:GHVT01025223.1.p3 GENE.GHVT01025223.1~~GHVT01025223.1.p3  ORF type:complete len:106 (-),score=22.57 GHVT01025223.1:306-623(-)